MKKVDDLILANLELLKTCETENEKLAVTAEIADLLSIKVKNMDCVLAAMQDYFRKLATHRITDEDTKSMIMKWDYKDILDQDFLNEI